MTDGTIQAIRHDIQRNTTSAPRAAANFFLKGVEGLDFAHQRERFLMFRGAAQAARVTPDESIFGKVEEALNVISTREREEATKPVTDEESAEVEVDDEPDFPEETTSVPEYSTAEESNQA